MSGTKNDNGKPRMSLLSPIALEKVARVMTFGAKKYTDNNWRQGFPFTRLLDAVGRHLNQYQQGETFDPESGESHLSHAVCGLLMLLEFEETMPDLDDRYFKHPSIKKASEAEIKEYGNKND